MSLRGAHSREDQREAAGAIPPTCATTCLNRQLLQLTAAGIVNEFHTPDTISLRRILLLRFSGVPSSVGRCGPTSPDGERYYRMKKPPSTMRSAPVMKSDAGDARNTAAPAVSSGSAKRPAGVRVTISL